MTSCRIGCVGLSSYSFFLIILRPPRYTRTDTLFPYTRHFRWQARVARSPAIAVIAIARSRRRRSRRVCIFGRLWVTAIATPLRDNDLWDRRRDAGYMRRSEEHTSELQSLMRISYAVFCMKKKHTTHCFTIHSPAHAQQLV